MKKLLLFLVFVFMSYNCFASPVSSLSITPTASSGTTISASDENSRNNTITSTFNAHDHDDINATGTVATGTWSASIVGATTTDSTTNDVWDITKSGNGIVFDVNKSGTGVGAVLDIDNDGTSPAILISQDGVNASDRQSVRVISSAAQTSAGLAIFSLTSTTSSQPTMVIENQSTSSPTIACLDINKSGSGTGIVIDILNSGTGASISDDSGATLTAGGVWTDAPSIFAEKENVSLAPNIGYINKLKDMKVFKYQKKNEMYEETQEVLPNGKIKKKYDKNKIKNPNATQYIGYILDDPSTPSELIAKDSEGNIIGISASQNTQFLLAVVKELVAKVEDLESRVP